MSLHFDETAVPALLHNPDTDPQTLSLIAQNFPQYREQVAAHPNSYGELREWIAQQAPLSLPDDAPPAVEELTEPRKPKRKKRGRVLLVAVVLIGVGGLGVGAWAGWSFLAKSEAARTGEALALEPAPIPSFAAGDTVTMLDLRGTTRAAAEQILADLGVTTDQIAVTERPWAGQTGLVLAQSPPYGSPEPQSAEIEISTVAKVPDPGDIALLAYIPQLEDLGAQVTLTRVYDPEATPGAIMEVTPAPGEVLPAQVEIVVAADPATVNVSELSAVDGSCSIRDNQVDGVTTTGAIQCSAREDVRSLSYLVNRNTDRVSGWAGISDFADESAKMKVEIFADAELLGTLNLAYGQRVPFEFKTTDALKITFSYLLTEHTDTWVWSEDLVLGEVSVTGDATKIEALRP